MDAKRPKQLKLPNQAYIDLPLWKDNQGLNSAEQESFEEGNSAGSANSTPQMTPTNSLSRTLQKKKTDSVLYGCAVLLASVALGLDIRELNRLQGPDEVLPKEEKKKREGLFQRASKFRRSASPVRLQQPRKEEAHVPSLCPSASTVNLLSMSSASTKCLLQCDSEDAPGSTLPNNQNAPAKGFLSEGPVCKKEHIAKINPALNPNVPSPTLLLKQGSLHLANLSSSSGKVVGHRRTMSDGNSCYITSE